jgi:hypothetical protein
MALSHEQKLENKILAAINKGTVTVFLFDGSQKRVSVIAMENTAGKMSGPKLIRVIEFLEDNKKGGSIPLSEIMDIQ